jgi:hypothetical protein
MGSTEGDCQFTPQKCEPNNAGFMETGCYHTLQKGKIHWEIVMVALGSSQFQQYNEENRNLKKSNNAMIYQDHKKWTLNNDQNTR